ncbi:MAG: hypothetical protein HQL58_09610 [Magnetococcales bacterium]|nr:hypothetical protein [Magnetococcales bacterium]
MDMVQAVIERNDGFFFDMANKAADVDHFIKADVLEWIGIRIEEQREIQAIARRRDAENQGEVWSYEQQYRHDFMEEMGWGI